VRRKPTSLKAVLAKVPPGRRMPMLGACTTWLHDKHPREFAALAAAQFIVAANPGMTLGQLKKARKLGR